MKKSLLALAALTAFAGVASAQSSVTLFGIVDLAARNVKNAGTPGVSSVSPSGSVTSRLGLRGVEDLGKGMRAEFWLEGDLTADNGMAAGQAWRRKSTVGLVGGFGEVRLGRDYTPDFWNHTVFDPFVTAGVGNSVNTFPALNGVDLVRADNSIGYFLPSGLGGIYGQIMHGMPETGLANTPGNRKVNGFRLGYQSGPINIAVSRASQKIGAPAYERTNFGGSYRIGNLTAMAQYNKGKATGGVDNGFSVDHMLLGGRYTMGKGIAKFSWIRSDGKGAGRNAQDATQWAFGYEYGLSRRTAVYGNYARINNKSQARYSIAGGNTPTAAGNGRNSTGYEFGVRHSF
jgi:predicted porin